MDKRIETLGEYKYLGVTFNSNGKLSREQQEAIQSATRAMCCLIGKCRKFDLPVDLQIELFRATVLPALSHGCEVWGYSLMREVETLHLKYLKHVLCVHKNTCNDIVYGETGSYPLYSDVKVKLLGYWIRLITGRREKLAYVLYQCLFNLDVSRMYTSPWLKEVKSVLNNCGMSGVWLQQEAPGPVWLRKAVEQRLRDHWITQWFCNINLKSTL